MFALAGLPKYSNISESISKPVKRQFELCFLAYLRKTLFPTAGSSMVSASPQAHEHIKSATSYFVKYCPNDFM